MDALAIFDLDGTVWDSAPGILHCYRHTLAAFDLAIPSDDALVELLGPPLLAALVDLGVAVSQLDRAREVYRAEYRRVGEARCRPYPGIVDLLDRLRDDRYTLATATSKGSEPAKRMLDAFGLTCRFDVIAAADMMATSHSKVDVIAAALSEVGPGAAANAVMIGDRRFDIEGGRHLGLATVGVRWGYAADGELEAARPTHLVDTVADLSRVLP